MICRICKSDPYHYVHNGLGYEPVAIVCCEYGIALWQSKGALRIGPLQRKFKREQNQTRKYRQRKRRDELKGDANGE